MLVSNSPGIQCFKYFGSFRGTDERPYGVLENRAGMLFFIGVDKEGHSGLCFQRKDSCYKVEYDNLHRDVPLYLKLFGKKGQNPVRLNHIFGLGSISYIGRGTYTKATTLYMRISETVL